MTSWPDTRESLLRRLADPDDADAWERFEQWYRPAIYRYVRSRGLQQSDAMDAVSATTLPNPGIESHNRTVISWNRSSWSWGVTA